MAYLDAEILNARLIWLKVASLVLVVGLILMGLASASALALLLGYAPSHLPL